MAITPADASTWLDPIHHARRASNDKALVATASVRTSVIEFLSRFGGYWRRFLLFAVSGLGNELRISDRSCAEKKNYLLIK
jgi:hypothetical protein